MITSTMEQLGVIARYRELLPVDDQTPVVSLAEGSTPLLLALRLSELAGCEVYLKCEGLNPTGSFKDRGMTVAVSVAVQKGARTLVCASTGNTSAAAAAYAARAGIKCLVLLPAGKIALGKLAQAIVHGAQIVGVDGGFDECLTLVRELAAEPGFAVVNSINPFRIEGQKTAAFEVVDLLGEAPTHHLLPVGNAGNITAYWKGYLEYQRLGRSVILPRMIGFQAEGAAPIYHGRMIPQPETIASAIRIGNPANWAPASQAIENSGGEVQIVSDSEIMAAQKWLASQEGVFVEPASAASVAGLQKLARTGPIWKNSDRLVLTVTGHGLKDTAVILQTAVPPPLARTRDDVLRIVENG